jgi:peptide/nickel transport system substrate-binding protein
MIKKLMNFTRKGRILLAAAAMMATGVVALGPSTSGASANGVMTLGWGDYGNAFSNNFNPYSATSVTLGEGAVYEPLWYFDPADGSQTHPWLATSYAWSNSGKTLTFQLQHGVNWSDGKPFTSADVAFTFNLMKKDPSINKYALPIASATAKGKYAVVVNFTTQAYTDLSYVAGDIYILPQHIWSKVKNPATYVASYPVGTGAYKVSSVTAAAITLVANKHYYMKGLPKIGKVEALFYNGNIPLDTAIESGSIDWGGAFIPNIKTAYLALNKKYYNEDLPAAMANIIPNVKTGPMSDVAVRRAFSDAIDRATIDQDVYDGQLGFVSSTGLVTPLFKSVLNPAYDPPTMATAGPNVSAAKAALVADGYTMGSDGFYQKNGQGLTITVTVPSGWTDYQQLLQLMTTEEAAAGINMQVSAPAQATALADLASGNFQAQIMYYGFTTSPWVYLDQMAGPVASSVGNQGGFSNATENADLKAIAKMPNESTAAAKKDFYAIEKIVSSQVARIPVVVQQGDAEFNGNVVKNFPTPQNPYAESASGIYPSAGWAMSRIELVK